MKIKGWKTRFFIWWRTVVFILLPMAVVWLFGLAAWDKFILKDEPDLSWDMLITIPLFFILAGAALSAIAALQPFNQEDM